jgi:hypothetical protein
VSVDDNNLIYAQLMLMGGRIWMGGGVRVRVQRNYPVEGPGNRVRTLVPAARVCLIHNLELYL